MNKKFLPGIVLLIGLAVVSAEEKKLNPSLLPPVSGKKDLTFEKDIKPMFEKGCIQCHGPKQQKANVRLDSISDVLLSGNNGSGIVPGDSANSRFVYDIARVPNHKTQMPPQKESNPKPLTKEDVGLVRAWIDQGAR